MSASHDLRSLLPANWGKQPPPRALSDAARVASARSEAAAAAAALSVYRRSLDGSSLSPDSSEALTVPRLGALAGALGGAPGADAARLSDPLRSDSCGSSSSSELISLEPASLSASSSSGRLPDLPRTTGGAGRARAPWARARAASGALARKDSASTAPLEPAARAVTSPALGAAHPDAAHTAAWLHFEAAGSAVASNASDAEDDDPQHLLVRGLGARLARAMLLGDGRDVRRAHLCADFDLHGTRSTVPCADAGFRNVATFVSALLPDARIGGALRAAGVFDAPTPAEVADRVEAAWAAGYDAKGAAQFGGKVGGKWLGAVELAVLLHSLGLRARVRSFEAKSAIPRKRFLDWVFAYFEGACGGANCLLHGDPDAGVDAKAVAPLFLQWDGHSVVVVGAERTRRGETRILVVDPLEQSVSALAGRNLPAKLFLVRRGESHRQLQAPRMQVVFLDRSPLLADPPHEDVPDGRRLSRIPRRKSALGKADVKDAPKVPSPAKSQFAAAPVAREAASGRREWRSADTGKNSGKGGKKMRSSRLGKGEPTPTCACFRLPRSMAMTGFRED